MKLTTESFITRANKIHNDFYDYKNVVVISSKIKVEIICPIHGSFLKNIPEHLYNHKNHGPTGCPKCGYLKGGAKHSLTTDDFINKSRNVHGNYYDYTKSLYTVCKNKIIITCPVHGDFSQRASHHLEGRGCRKCSDNKRSKDQALSIPEVIEKFRSVHKDLYDYSYITNYTNWMHKLPIKCNKHGIFYSSLAMHVHRKLGCPDCSPKSFGELKISDILHQNDILFEREKTFPDFKNIQTKQPYRFDFYIPSLNYIIEFDGQHHFKSIEYWGGDETFEKIKEGDRRKTEYCKNNKINMLRIRFDENLVEKLQNAIPQLIHSEQ